MDDNGREALASVLARVDVWEKAWYGEPSQALVDAWSRCKPAAEVDGSPAGGVNEDDDDLMDIWRAAKQVTNDVNDNDVDANADGEEIISLLCV
jgi:hypothetical protein